jgi:NAD(P)-dependent dehydrogenase (short-subunit alcohol dehydrogenase family)
MMECNFEGMRGKVAMVSGSSRGIGRGIAEELGRGGVRVVLNGRNAEELDTARKDLVAQGFDVRAVPGSIADAETAGRMVAAATETWGRIDFVVSNVGISPFYGPLTEIDSARFAKTMVTNTWSLVAMVQAALAAGLGGGGSVVAVSTAGTATASTTSGAYVASKVALESLCSSLARELGPLGVRVNAVAPGLVKTHLSRALWEGNRGERQAGLLPMRRFGEPIDIGKAVRFLLSDESSWITGTVMRVDGGFVLIGGDLEIIEAAAANGRG